MEKEPQGIKSLPIKGKGRGVVATKQFEKGDYIVEYCGELIDYATAMIREEQYSREPATGCYMYYFKYQNKTFCVDASTDDGTLGRLINHSFDGNCQCKLIVLEGTPHLYFQALKTINVGEELLYDYGDCNK